MDVIQRVFLIIRCVIALPQAVRGDVIRATGIICADLLRI